MYTDFRGVYIYKLQKRNFNRYLKGTMLNQFTNESLQTNDVFHSLFNLMTNMVSIVMFETAIGNLVKANNVN